MKKVDDVSRVVVLVLVFFFLYIRVYFHVGNSKYIGRMTLGSLSLGGHLQLASDHCTRILLSGSEAARSVIDLFQVWLLIRVHI